MFLYNLIGSIFLPQDWVVIRNWVNADQITSAVYSRNCVTYSWFACIMARFSLLSSASQDPYLSAVCLLLLLACCTGVELFYISLTVVSLLSPYALHKLDVSAVDPWSFSAFFPFYLLLFIHWIEDCWRFGVSAYCETKVARQCTHQRAVLHGDSCDSASAMQMFLILKLCCTPCCTPGAICYWE